MPESPAVCSLCGEPMPKGEEMFRFHGYSGPCPKKAEPPVASVQGASDEREPGLCTTNGKPVAEVRAAQTNETGQHAAYIVLCPDERAKGFVRPYRDAYRHVGPAVAGPGNRLVNSVAHPELLIEVAPKDPSDLDAPAERVVRYWSRDQLAAAGKRCGGTVTTMGRALSETYARNPKFYGATFCVTCNQHFPVAEFVWTADGARVGS